MRVIDRATTKELLGITTSTYDNSIDAAIPRIDSVIKLLSNQRWNYRAVGSTTEDSTTVRLSSVYIAGGRAANYDDLEEYIEVGQLISGAGIPAGAYISEVVYNWPEGVITDDNFSLSVELSAAATATGDSITVYLGIPIGYQQIIAKGIWYLIQQTATSIPSTGFNSRRMGPLSWGMSGDDSKIDGKTGMPAWFVKAFPVYHSGH